MAANGSHVEPRRVLGKARGVYRDLGRALAQLEAKDLPDRLGRFVVEPGEHLDPAELAEFLRACRRGHEGMLVEITVVAREVD